MFATLAGAYPPALSADATGADGPLRSVLLDQLVAGLELLSDGAVGAPDPVAATVAGMDGVAPGAPSTWFDGRRVVARPLVRRAPAWREAVVVPRWRAARALADELATERAEVPRPVKASLLGPYTLGRVADRGRLGRRPVTLAFAEAVAAEVTALADAGALIVQIDEPALTRIGPEDAAERALAAAALRRFTDGVPDVHLTLAVVDGSAEHAGAHLFFDAPFHSYLFDVCAGPDNWRLISRAPGDRGIVVGVVDARVPVRESKEVLVWGARYAAVLNARGLDRVGLAPSSGLDGLTHDEARIAITSLGEAAGIAALSDPEELRRSVDPRSVDLRSAALGRYEPVPDRPRRRRRSPRPPAPHDAGA